MNYTFFLDADDTIFDFQAAFRAAIQKTFLECGLPFSEKTVEVYHTINESLWRRLERGGITKDELLSLRFSAVLEELSLSYDDKILTQAYMENLAFCSVLIDGAEDFLKELSSLGDIYFITNGFSKVQRSRMAKFEMQRYAKGIFISEEVGFEKPDLRFLERVLPQVKNFQAEKTFVIGDGLPSDILLAERAGLKSIWFNPKKKPLPKEFSPTFTAFSYGEILSLIRKEMQNS